jgi:hypothetical protein
LLAEIQPPKKAECVTLGDVKCTLNTRWALRGVPFVTTRPFESRVFRTLYTVAGKPGTSSARCRASSATPA